MNRSLGASLIPGDSTQTIANRLTAAGPVPNRGAAMMPASRAAGPVRLSFAPTRRRRRRKAKGVTIYRSKRRLKIGKARKTHARRARASHAKFVKGSLAARRHMAKLRLMRKRG